MDGLQSAILAAQAVKRDAQTMLMSKDNVVATGIGYKTVGNVTTNELAIIVSVIRKLPGAQLTAAVTVPQTVGGMKTVPASASATIRSPLAHSVVWCSAALKRIF